MDARIKIRVFDRATRSGIESKVFLLVQGNEIDVGDTRKPEGILVLRHICQLGERFLAKAHDPSYYDSNESRCDTKVDLSLRKREKPIVRREERTLIGRHKNGTPTAITLEWSLIVRSVFSPINLQYCTLGAEGEISRVIGEIAEVGGEPQWHQIGLPVVAVSYQAKREDFCSQRSEVDKEAHKNVFGELDGRFQEIVERDLPKIREELKQQGYEIDFVEDPLPRAGSPHHSRKEEP